MYAMKNVQKEHNLNPVLLIYVKIVRIIIVMIEQLVYLQYLRDIILTLLQIKQ